MSTTKIRESVDDYNIEHADNPTMPMRDMTEYETFEDTGFTLEELPEPNLWRCLIFPKQPKRQTESGLILAKGATDAEEALPVPSISRPVPISTETGVPRSPYLSSSTFTVDPG